MWLTVTVCGLATILILATAEYWRLVRIGVGWRTGPNPAPRPAYRAGYGTSSAERSP